MKIIPYGKQWLDEDDISAVVEVLRGDWITQGPMIERFEKEIANYIGVRHAVAFNSGTAALHGAMFAAGLSVGDSLITTPITFVATSNSLIYLGGKPTFVDIDMNTYCMDLEKIKPRITENSKVVVPVDFAGYPVDLKRLREITDDYNLIIIEDAAHALGAKRYGKMVGKEADMTMFSFHPVKHITTGEGGIILTDNSDYYDKLRIFRNHGITKDPKKLKNKDEGPWYYEMQDLGYNFRITDIQCALGLSQLKKLDNFLSRRNEIASKYNRMFRDLTSLKTPPHPPYPNSLHAYHIYPLLVYGIPRRSLFNKLKQDGIRCQVHYIPVHWQPFYKNNFGFKQRDFPVAENFYNHEITIPLYPQMTDDEIEFVINRIVDTLT
ncbi:MAG: UDP-4-amino-4,6-dideoxy-N-acetyl-beta-L-altrosamine transaminase [Promethearchaeota archaeon]